ncbi:MAG: diguanylate cyclase [Senegalia sp. (in: firmicutes)]
MKTFKKLCTITDYMYYRGISKEYIHPNNILISKGENINFKIKDLASITFDLVTNKYSTYFDFTRTHEMIKNPNLLPNYEYIYTLGNILEYLISDDIYNNEDINNTYDKLNFIKSKLLSNDINVIYKDFKSILKDIGDFDETEYNNHLKDTREILNFNNPIIARDNEINYIMENNKKIKENNSEKKIILIRGEEGSGKTRLLSEIEYRLDLKNIETYKVKIVKDKSGNLSPISQVLKSMIKKHGDTLLDKYGQELVKVLPILKDSYNISSSDSLSKEKEKLRLYDRITNYIFELSNKHKYIIFDNLENADEDIFNIINYMINNIKDKPITIIMSYNRNNLIKNKLNHIENWSFNKGSASFKLLKFNLEETSLLIKNILGMNKKAMNFSTFLYKETDGNPRYIEEIIKNLFVRKELFINEDGVWDYKAGSYSKIYIPTNITEVIENQLRLLPLYIYNTLENIAIFNTSISKNIINKMSEEIELECVDMVMERLVSMKLLEEKLEDWGYTYDIYNTQIKNYIYYNLNEENRIKLHKRASDILEEIYEKEDRNNIEELIYHLKVSNQYKKAIYYCINFAKTMQQLNINKQSIEIWKMAKSCLNYIDSSEYNIEIYMNLAKLYDEEGEKSRAIRYYKKALNVSYDLKKFETIVDIKNLLSDVYNRITENEKALEIVLKSKKLAKNINYVDGLLNSVILLNKINYYGGNNNDVFKRSLKYLKIAIKNNNYNSAAELFNQLGISTYLLGDLEDSKRYYKKSISYYEKSKNTLEITKPINNLGLIYSEHYNDTNKAMSYFQKGLNISKKHNSMINIAYFYANISEVYLYENKYDLAKKHTERLLDIAFDIDEKSLVSSAYLNLARIYLETGELDKLKVYMEELNKIYDKGLIIIDEVDKYLETSMLFYYVIADYEKVLKITKEIKNKYKGINDKNHIIAITMEIIIKYIKDEDFDINEVYNLNNYYKINDLKFINKYYLLIFSMNTILKDDLHISQIILEILDKFRDKNDSNLVKSIKIVLESSLNDNLELIENEYKKIQKHKMFFLEIMYSNIIAKKYFERKEYNIAANYYVVFIESVYKLISKFNEKDIKMNISKSFHVNEVINRLDIIKKVINGQPENVKEDFIDYDCYFDIDKYQNLFSNERFLKIVSNQYNDPLIMNINCVGDLVYNLGTNYLKNIDLIMRYAMKEVLATRAIVGLYDESKDEFDTIMSNGIEKNDEVKRNIKKLFQTQKKGVIKTFKDEKLPQNITSMIFLPIYSSKHHSIDEIKERRNYKNNYKKIKGYIYLDTDKLFNKFNGKNFFELKKLINLIILNIDNYYFKVLSSIDKLTNVYTRKYMETVYDELYNKCRKENSIFSLLMLDIDRFKNVNDTYGHPTGDVILSKIGNILKENLRNTDIIARYGGEEFIVILPSTSKENGYLVAEKLRKIICSNSLLNNPGDITVSIGVSAYPEDGQFKEEIIENADKALYNAKSNNRNNTVIWDKTLLKSAKTINKLAGIITGDIVHDHRIVLTMTEIIGLVKEDMPKIDKYFLMLGRLIETTEAEEGSLIEVNNEEEIKNIYTRERFVNKWVDNKINTDPIKNIIKSKMGRYFIDWEQTDDIDTITLNPNWKSNIIVPMISNGELKGIIKLSVPIKEKEFDYNSYNFVNILSNIIPVL